MRLIIVIPKTGERLIVNAQWTGIYWYLPFEIYCKAY